MITITDKLFITKEVNDIVVRYAKEIVLKELLMSFSFVNGDGRSVVSELIQDVGFYKGDVPPEIELQLLDLIYCFTETLSKEKRTALWFWVLNENYFDYLDDTEVEEEDDSSEFFNQKFGRELASKIYNPDTSNLDVDLCEQLKYFLMSFASEGDFSLIDDYTTIHLNETMDSYCV